MFNYCTEAMGGMPEDVVGGLGVGRVEYLVHSGGGHDILFGIVLLIYQYNKISCGFAIVSYVCRLLA